MAGELATLALDGTSHGTALAFERLARGGRLALPSPGGGSTGLRFEALAEIGAVDLSLARLAEGHCDAHSILFELGAQPRDGTYGVWAADPPSARATATRLAGGGYRLHGRKAYASGASRLGRALVTAHAADGLRLFDVSLEAPEIRPIESSWRAVGMASSDSLDVELAGVAVSEEEAIGGPGAYLSRPGFWHGGVGVAACWFGGALGCLRMLLHRFDSQTCDDHVAAHIGAVVTACHAMQVTLVAAAAAIDADPEDQQRSARERALLVRSVVERGCDDVLRHCQRATGSSALVFDAAHARRCADLPVYVRQHHAERDLASLGRLVLESEGATPCR